MRRFIPSSFTVLLLTGAVCSAVWSSHANYDPQLTISYTKPAVDSDQMRYPIKPSDNVLKSNLGGMAIKDPPTVERKVSYDPDTRMYTITETIGGRFFKSPQYLSFEEFQKYEMNRLKDDYWRQRNGSNSVVPATNIIPKIYVENQAFDRVFGGGSVDIRPQGSFDLTFQGRFNRNENPLANVRAQRQNNFDFDEKIQLNVVGNIGDKLKITTNYNTESQFDFENQVKLDYTGYEDEIIKKIEAGNVSLPLSGSLISGSQALFGLKTQLQFGRLTVTSVFSQQRSEQKEITINSGSQTTEFRIQADNYEANKHYFLAHFFREQYNQALADPLVPKSDVIINKVEVWVTNRGNVPTDARDVIGLIDLGENVRISNPTIVQVTSKDNNPYPNADERPKAEPHSNNLLEKITPALRQSDSQALTDLFEATGGRDNFASLSRARKLTDKEFTFHPRLGYISLNQALNVDEILTVAYRYVLNGKEYQVGEFASEKISDPQKPIALVTKLLKNEITKVNLPTWDLMMKNIYNIGAYQVNPQSFKLDVFRLDEKTSVEKQVMTEGVNTTGKLFLQLINLDNNNVQQEAKPDGVFDFIEGTTIDAQNGRIIIPSVEPFGKDLEAKFAANETALKKKYVYQQLYDTTQFAARQFPELNRYFLKGRFQGTSSSEFSLNAINVPQGSVVVTAGTVKLQEGVDYTVDYSLGRVKIVNEGILNSGQQIKIKLESNQLFAVQSKTFFGSRFDYKFNKKLNLGGTVVRLSEKPLTQKVNLGDEPIRNTMYGFDVNYNTESRLLTRFVDYIPLINTKAKSSINVSGEFAQLVPGHSRALNTAGNDKGISYIDDFEGSKSIIDLRGSSSWFLSGTPQRFPEHARNNDLSYGFNRARLAYYNIDPLFYSKTNSATPSHIKTDKAQLSNHYVRQVIEQEVFPNKQVPNGQPNVLQSFDLYFNPHVRGQYNYSVDDLDANGRLNQPATKWGGIMRRLETFDFEALNVEFIEFWVLDPFIYDTMATGGDLYLNLGNISEDVLKDGRKALENGLPFDGDLNKVDTTVWGRIPKLQPVTQAFDNNVEARKRQDVGLDGLSTEDERSFFGDSYLEKLKAKFGDASRAYQQAVSDPSADDYHYFRGGDLDNVAMPILERYSRFNLMESNSKTSEQSKAETGIETSASTPTPDGEDYNRDNNSSKSDEYFEYKVAMHPDSLIVGKNFITDKVTSTVELEDKTRKQVTWYQFKVPISQYQEKVGGIQDFKSIRFMRMYMTGFTDSVVLRFARLQLDRSEWRKNDPRSAPVTIDTLGITGTDNSTLDVSTVNREENGTRTPIPYVLPPGIQQERNYQDIRGATFRNEQSLALTVCNLKDGQARAAYKNVNLDFRSYKRVEMFVHAEGLGLQNGDVTAFVRFGTDFNSNYYEYEIPLEITSENSPTEQSIWPASNKLEIPFSVLQIAKQQRNRPGQLITDVYTVADGKNKIHVKGQPDLSKVRVIMLGIRNPRDNGPERCAQVWFNELRMSEFDEDGGWAAIGRVNAQLADFATVTVSGSHSTFGFGSIDKKVSERQKSDDSQVDLSSSVELGKFLPEKAGLKVPMFVNYSQAISKPQFAPSSPDILLENAIAAEETQKDKDSLLRISTDFTERKGINFTNVHKDKTNGGSPRIYDVANFNATYAFTQSYRRNYQTEYDSTLNYKGSLGYSFNSQPKNLRPFEKVIKSNSLRIIKDFNVNLRPYAYDFRIDGDRLYSVSKLRNLDKTDTNGLGDAKENFNKSFRITRNYGLKWDFTKSLKFEFTATNLSIVDEPEGRIVDSNRYKINNSLRNLGRTVNYNHSVSLNYTVPINKLPFLDFTSLNVRYTSRYEWKADPLAARQVKDAAPDTSALSGVQIGNTIANTQSINVNPTLTLTTLYNKSKYLRSIGNNSPAPKKPVVSGLKGGLNKQKLDSLKKKSQKEEKASPVSQGLRFAARLLISLKSVSGTYTQTNSTTIPGYKGKTRYFGLDDNYDNAPGIGFVLGDQRDIKRSLADKGLLTIDTRFNSQIITLDKKELNARANFEPLPDLRVEFSAVRSLSFTKSELFKYDPSINDFQLAQPAVINGSFNISAFTLRTAFSNLDKVTAKSATFEEFQKNRNFISARLAQENPNSDPAKDSAGFKDGYGRYQQDVLLPAFLAAYSGKSIESASLNYFPSIPMPNYKVTFTGLTRIKAVAEIFSSVSMSHSYKSSFSLNSFSTLVKYTTAANGFVDSRDISNNFLPFYQAQQASISEQFAPLLGFEMRLKNNVSGNIEYRKTRNLNLSLSNGQLAEQRDNQITIGAGYKTSDIKLPIKVGKGQLVLKNDVTFRCDVTIGDTRNVIHRMDVENGSELIGGNYTVTVKPSADYVINQRLNIRLFYDRRVVKPYTSQSFKTANTNVGVSLRFTLGT